MPECPVCGRDLKNPDSPGHLNSKFHLEALKKGGNAAPKETAKQSAIELSPKLDTSEKVALTPIKLPPKLDRAKAPPQLKKLELTPLKIETKPLKPKPVIEKGTLEYASGEDEDLGIPMIPEPPKRKENAQILKTDVSSGILERIEEMEAEDVKVVLVNCERCGEVIPVPIPRDMVLYDELPVVPVTYVHFNSQNKDQHCITLYLDHDFDMRRKRYSSVVIASKYHY